MLFNFCIIFVIFVFIIIIKFLVRINGEFYIFDGIRIFIFYFKVVIF